MPEPALVKSGGPQELYSELGFYDYEDHLLQHRHFYQDQPILFHRHG